MEALFAKLADGIPAVAVALIFLFMGLFVILPIVKLLVDRFVPLVDRIIVVLEIHGKSSQQLADILQDAMKDQRELFEMHLANEKRERKESEEMLQAQIEKLKEENKRLKEEKEALQEEVAALKKRLETQTPKAAKGDK